MLAIITIQDKKIKTEITAELFPELLPTIRVQQSKKNTQKIKVLELLETKEGREFVAQALELSPIERKKIRRKLRKKTAYLERFLPGIRKDAPAFLWDFPIFQE